MDEIYKALNVIMASQNLLLYPSLVRQCGENDDEGGDDGDDTDDDIFFGDDLHYPGLIINITHNFHGCGNSVKKVSGPIGRQRFGFSRVKYANTTLEIVWIMCD